MEFSRTEYPTLLASLQPEQAVDVLNDRVGLIKKINNDIADWLQERRRIEETYVASLRKLARRPQQDGAAALGIFQMPWQRVVSGTENLAASHEALAAKIETDVENPLRNFVTRNREMQSLATTQGNLISLAKDLSNAQKKAAKGGRRADTASTDVEEASRQWESQAPFVFEQLQAADETRLNHLRDVLTQFQTHEVDAIEKNRLSAESILNALLNVETADEIKTFAARHAGGRGSLARRASSTTGSARPPSSQNRAPPTPPPPRHADTYSQRTNSFAGQDRLTPLPESTPTKEKSKLGGLKRLGTVMGRRKSTVPSTPSSTAEKRKTRSFVPFRRGDSSQSFQDLEETGQDLTPSTTQDERPTSSVSHDRLNDLPSARQPEQHTGLTNGAATSQTPLELSAGEVPSQPTLMDTVSTPQTQPQPAERFEPPPSAPGAFPDSHQEAPASPLVNEESARNFMIRDQPIQEDESEAQQALNTMANQLRTQAQTSGLNRGSGTVRGRRDVRNTMYVPSSGEPSAPTQSVSRAFPPVMTPPATSPLENIVASPIPRLAAAATLQDEHGVGSDTTSIHSSRSLAFTSLHSDLHEAGLNASIVETVQSWFTESGISKSLVLGEVAFAYNPSGFAESDHETIRMQKFELLDKVAVNPIFLTQVKSSGGTLAEEQAGSYTVSTSAIRRPSPLIGLKYQLHMDENNLGRYSPVLITPAWQIIEGQVSVIILYSLNPLFQSGAEALNLKNVQITVNLDTSGEGAGKAVSAMMAPTQGATFRRKTSAVVWRYNDLSVKPQQERLLVRFMTEGGMPKKGTVELKFDIPGATASGVGVEKMVTSAGGTDSDPFADDTGDNLSSARESAEEKRFEVVPTKAKLISGRYSAS
ncbi:Muniscin C-terminal mu homology domain-containing protein [Exophiala viscosa]|uniref:Muniscin C-terminal mu homology domain-containing protein n=1 Tax=Exophiala viscosa TaxID=2486360 RepID=A0AAN6DQA1_9EURO|nr:Muniscin C-terminal mu homology domain-containing protein [Exophiala viscosa]